MAFDAHKNLAYSTIAIAPSPGLSGTTATLQTGDGAKFPAVPFNVLIWPAGPGIPLTTNAEIARVTAMSGDAITAMTRATATEPNVVGPRTVLVGDQICVSVSGKTLADLEAAISALSPTATTSIASSATPTPNADTTRYYDVTALAAAATFGAPMGTPVNFQQLLIRIKDNGTARALAWDAAYTPGGAALPTTTVLSKILTIGFIYNTANALNKWQCIAVAQEA